MSYKAELSDLDRSSETSLTQQLVDAISAAIESGELGPGEQLPPTRELAELAGVNHLTAVRAYRKLRELGLVSAHVGRGTFVRGAGSAAPADAPGAGARLDRLAALRAAGVRGDLRRPGPLRHAPARRHRGPDPALGRLPVGADLPGRRAPGGDRGRHARGTRAGAPVQRRPGRPGATSSRSQRSPPRAGAGGRTRHRRDQRRQPGALADDAGAARARRRGRLRGPELHVGVRAVRSSDARILGCRPTRTGSTSTPSRRCSPATRSRRSRSSPGSTTRPGATSRPSAAPACSTSPAATGSSSSRTASTATCASKARSPARCGPRPRRT